MDKLVAAAAADMLVGVTVANARARAVALKRHADHAAIPGVWARFRRVVLMRDTALLDAAIG